MEVIVGATVDELYRKTCQGVLDKGMWTDPRGLETVELLAPTLILTDPCQNLVTSRLRKINYSFAVAEFVWMISGLNRVDVLTPFNRQMARFSDDGLVLHGSYGPPLAEQLSYVIETLRRDTASRQAVLTIWRPRPGPSKDIPCTVAFQFLIREGCLYMIATMRSNDAWLGVPYDIFSFTSIQRYVADALQVRVGSYIHHPGSLHLYGEHLDRAHRVASQDAPEGVVTPSPRYPMSKDMIAALCVPGEPRPRSTGSSDWDSYRSALDWYVDGLDAYLDEPFRTLIRERSCT